MARLAHPPAALAVRLPSCSLALLLVCSAPPCLRGESSGGAPIELGSRKQIFLDDYLIALKTNVALRIHPAEKSRDNPVIRQTEPWEDAFNIVYGSVLRDGDKYKAWYKSGPGVSYAESDDGIQWVKPPLDLVTVNGVKTTSSLSRARTDITARTRSLTITKPFGVIRIRLGKPMLRAATRMGYLSIDWEYKGPREGRFREGQRRGLGVAGSPDGIHWKLIDSFATEAICDGATHWMFDPVRGKTVLFGRTLKTPPEIEAAWSKYDWYKAWYSGRAVGRIESPDFVKWNVTAPMAAPVIMTADLQDRPGTEIYSLMVFPYESVYIGLVQVFLPPDACARYSAVSRDGEHFTRWRSRGVHPNGPVGADAQSSAGQQSAVTGDEVRFTTAGGLTGMPPTKARTPAREPAASAWRRFPATVSLRSTPPSMVAKSSRSRSRSRANACTSTRSPISARSSLKHSTPPADRSPGRSPFTATASTRKSSGKEPS